MKKSVVIIIALIYIASIALVSFFGLQFKVFEEIVDVESIEITNEGQKHSEQHGDYVVVKPNANGEYKFQIQYRVFPDDATNTEVDFVYDTQTAGVTIDENGVVTLERRGVSVKVFVIAKDGTNAQDTITIIAN